MNSRRSDSLGRRPTVAQRRFAACGVLVSFLLGATATTAQVAEVDLRSTVFLEPSEESDMRVINPGVALRVRPSDWLKLDLGYEADIVSGASERLKAGPLASPDVISRASVVDTRHVVGGGFTVTRKQSSLSVGYAYGTEKDYRSNAITVSGATEFFQRNTRLELAYARGFDSVCNNAFTPDLDPTLRVALDSSVGCFSSAPNRQAQDINLDNFRLGWTQNWTPVLATQLVFNGAVQNGFLGNPYRAVLIGAAGQQAQENHPEDRARGSVALRVKYYAKPLKTALTFGVRGYRDTWDILSQTYELEAERYLVPQVRVLLRGRYYRQAEALFWSDDYTGGEPVFGPRGQYWSGDRELSPLSSFGVGGRVVVELEKTAESRVMGIFSAFDIVAAVDYIKTNLEDFTWAGVEPDDTGAFILTLGLTGAF